MKYYIAVRDSIRGVTSTGIAYLTIMLMLCSSTSAFSLSPLLQDRANILLRKNNLSSLHGASYIEDQNDRGKDLLQTNVKNLKRRNFLASTASLLSLSGFSFVEKASAAVDLSGVSSSGGGSGGNSLILDQIRTGGYDGSASSRVQQIRQSESSSNSGSTNIVKQSPPEVDNGNAAVNVFVSNARQGKVGIAKLKTKYEAEVLAPSGSKARYAGVSFEFPSDWLQLDRALGGLQFVDQRNGDKLYVLEATLPEGKSLADVSKSFFGESVFGDERGAIPRSGNTIDEFKVSYAKVISDCPEGMCSTRRRALVKYATVTGNGYRVERRALVDAFEVGSGALMIVTSSNAVKFDAKGAERDTVEAIVDSFRVEA